MINYILTFLGLILRNLPIAVILLAAIIPLYYLRRSAFAVIKRNFIGYFNNPTGYVFLCVFVLLTSLAAFIGISVALTAGEGFESADDWAALVACAVITFNGVRLFRDSLREVLDVTAPGEIRDRVREIAQSVPGVEGVDLLRVRQSGLALWVDIHVEVEGDIPVRAGHEIAHLVKGRLLDSDLRILDALVHVEPRPDRL